MHWKQLTSIPKFTTMEEVFKQFGQPEFKLGDKLIYYMGDGYYVSYQEKKFKVIDLQRSEYGDIGQYATRVSYFEKEIYANLTFGFDGKYKFDANESQKQIEICNGIFMGETYRNVQNILKSLKKSYYAEGDTDSLINGEIQFTNQFIYYNNYAFLFFSKSKKATLNGVQFALIEAKPVFN